MILAPIALATYLLPLVYIAIISSLSGVTGPESLENEP